MDPESIAITPIDESGAVHAKGPGFVLTADASGRKPRALPGPICKRRAIHVPIGAGAKRSETCYVVAEVAGVRLYVDEAPDGGLAIILTRRNLEPSPGGAR